MVFRRSDWAKNSIAAKLAEMPLTCREKHYAKVHAMAQCWPVPPSEMLWGGSTYARPQNISLSIKTSMPGSMESSAL